MMIIIIIMIIINEVELVYAITYFRYLRPTKLVLLELYMRNICQAEYIGQGKHKMFNRKQRGKRWKSLNSYKYNFVLFKITQ